MTIPKGTHYEAEITFFKEGDQIIVQKRYRKDVECIQWLNQHLSQYYDSEKAQPVAQHEFRALQLLEPYNISAKPLALEKDAITMQFCGIPFELQYSLSRKLYRQGCRQILDLFSKLNFSHNDLLPSNLLIDSQNKLRVIDFTLSEFGEVCIMDVLPNSRWARAYRDREVLDFYSTKQWVKKNVIRFPSIFKKSCLKGL